MLHSARHRESVLNRLNRVICSHGQSIAALHQRHLDISFVFSFFNWTPLLGSYRLCLYLFQIFFHPSFILSFNSQRCTTFLLRFQKIFRLWTTFFPFPHFKATHQHFIFLFVFTFPFQFSFHNRRKLSLACTKMKSICNLFNHLQSVVNSKLQSSAPLIKIRTPNKKWRKLSGRVIDFSRIPSFLIAQQNSKVVSYQILFALICSHHHHHNHVLKIHFSA